MRLRAYLSTNSTSFCFENWPSVLGLMYCFHSWARRSSQSRSMYPERDFQMWHCDLTTYRMTVSTFCVSVRLLSLAFSLYSSKKSSTSWSTSLEK